MKKYECPTISVISFATQDRITWNEANNDGFNGGMISGEGVEDWE